MGNFYSLLQTSILVVSMGERLISAVDWQEKQRIWSCSLLCYDEGYSRIVLELGANLSFRILKGRFCIGFYGLVEALEGAPDSWKGLNPCPDGAQVEKGKQCRKCAKLDVARSCLLCNGEKCSADLATRRACEDVLAYVYLASFGERRIKAGVSHESRVPKRWIEQGADVAKRVLVGNGREVRSFEKRIQDELGALRQVKTKEKVNFVSGVSDLALSIQLLEELESRVHKRFPRRHHFHEDPWVLSPYYCLPQLDRRPLALKVEERVEISGQVLGVKGSVLLLKVGDLPFALDLNRLVGRKVDTEEAVQTKTQAGLESFLFKPKANR